MIKQPDVWQREGQVFPNKGDLKFFTAVYEGRNLFRLSMNYLVHRFNRILQKIAFFLIWIGAAVAALLASLWGIEVGQL